ncbi:MAG: ABC transporter permease [Planctomycetota bacterium]
MRAIGAIAWRELASSYRTATGWVVLALYLALSGFYVGFAVLEPGGPASLRPFFAVSQWLLLFVAPAVSMRLFSEELRTGTLEPLRAAPVGEWAIVIGKLTGAVAFLLTMLAPTLIFPLILAWLADPEPGPIVSGYLGLVLVGTAYLSVGMLWSVTTASQVLSYLGPFFVFVGLWIATGTGASLAGPPLDEALYALSFQLRIRDFARGVIDLGHITFFLAFTTWFAVLTVVALEVRRWR